MDDSTYLELLLVLVGHVGFLVVGLRREDLIGMYVLDAVDLWVGVTEYTCKRTLAEHLVLLVHVAVTSY
jgi:hypothetical protein